LSSEPDHWRAVFTVTGDHRVPQVSDRRRAMASAADRDPLHHVHKMQTALVEIKTHLREDIEKVDEPQLRAMFETSAEVLGGLIKAFGDYERKNEAAWRR
jgi:hypothetical protein